MKDKIVQLLTTVKDRLKQALQEQAESPTTVALRERYDSFPPNAQKAIKITASLLALLLILYWPLSNLMDSSDLNSKFDEKRSTIKSLLKVTRELQNAPQPPAVPGPANMKKAFTAKLGELGIKDDQVKSNEEVTAPKGKVKEAGIEIRIEKITLKQAVDLSYGLEHDTGNARLTVFELRAQVADPHYYDAHLKLVAFSPNIETPSSGIGPLGKKLEASKLKGPPPPPPPAGSKEPSDE